MLDTSFRVIMRMCSEGHELERQNLDRVARAVGKTVQDVNAALGILESVQEEESAKVLSPSLSLSQSLSCKT